jgi:hypothetical protein
MIIQKTVKKIRALIRKLKVKKLFQSKLYVNFIRIFSFDYEQMVALEPRSEGNFFRNSPPAVHPVGGTARRQSGISLDNLRLYHRVCNPFNLWFWGRISYTKNEVQKRKVPDYFNTDFTVHTALGRISGGCI